MKTPVLEARLPAVGQLPVLESRSLPHPGPDEVLVEMVAGALNPVDLRVKEGAIGKESPFPRTAGIEGVGLFEGRLVLISGGGLGLTRDGTLTEVLAAPRHLLVPVPDGVPPEQAACCGVVGATAVRVLALGAPKPEDRVLVLGAGGSVGVALIQLLQGRASAIFGQIRDAERRAAVRSAGAEPVVARDPDALREAIAEIAPTVVLDGLGGPWTGAILSNPVARSSVVLFGASAERRVVFDAVGFYRSSASLRGYSGLSESPEVLRAAMAEALTLAASGRLTFPVAECTSLTDVAAAYSRLEAGAGGKIIVELGPGGMR